mmetsp:Transcript_908/g.1950  ORF Transcript_908/g.1950 Transcript_908/m.1950 type:complete len:283 (+) Transcript_908:608-1456(+)
MLAARRIAGLVCSLSDRLSFSSLHSSLSKFFSLSTARAMPGSMLLFLFTLCLISSSSVFEKHRSSFKNCSSKRSLNDRLGMDGVLSVDAPEDSDFSTLEDRDDRGFLEYPSPDVCFLTGTLATLRVSLLLGLPSVSCSSIAPSKPSLFLSSAADAVRREDLVLLESRPGLSALFFSLPGLSALFFNLPGLSARFFNLPGLSGRFFSLPGLSGRFWSIPIPSTFFFNRPGLSGRFFSLPGLSARFFNLPGLSARFFIRPGLCDLFLSLPGLCGLFLDEVLRSP